MVKRIVISELVESFIYNSQGKIVNDILLEELKKNNKVIVSLEKMEVVTSSFLNSAFIGITDLYSFEHFKKSIIFTNGQPHVNNMIKDRILYAYKNKECLT
ncbi:hypothetical protein B5723_03120 [Mammaliicoccus sciuri]|uniref:STAS-like domain-containing protein n=1 Tax=Mammaliicoccus sciuri TaxID=1296 RepID=UPI000A001957|nr:STAS-like domain-containing protein [Mammaliicoccus sciuri]ORI05517.1 hypothetical protein B5723_03120 [Mammaliicoccus sciuri]